MPTADVGQYPRQRRFSAISMKKSSGALTEGLMVEERCL
jgi:hypothetical protein